MKPQKIDRIEKAIRHIESSLDVDPWAMEIAVEAMRKLLVKDNHDFSQGLAKDTISRQAAIETARTMYERCDTLDMLDYCNLMLTALKELPSAQPEPQWIPVSERLPEVGKDVMVCYDFKGHRSVLIGVLYDDEKFHGYDDEYLTPEGRKYRKAVAWMPLPEPYRAERRTDE